MGLFDLFKDDDKKAPADTRSALERSKDSPTDAGLVGNTSMKLVDNLLDIGIDGKGPFDPALTVARKAMAKHPGDPEEAVDDLVSSHLRLAAAEGFVTSLGGFFTLPVSLPANVVAFYALATRMTAAIAHVRGYDITNEQIRTAVLLTLVGADADDLLAKAGIVAPAGRLTNLAAQRLPGPALMMVNKAVGFRLLSTATTKTLSRLGRAVPLVGGVVGGALDGWLIRRVAENARREFPRAAGQVAAG